MQRRYHHRVHPLSYRALDTMYLGTPGAALAFVVHGREGAILVECGCAVAFQSICAQLAEIGLKPSELKALLLTHIHLDHAGSAGHFARVGVPVFVHPRGERHLVDPARLIAGSRAVHGERYDAFFGDPLPIAPAQVHAVADRATIEIAGLHIEAIETLGHARHHHAWRVCDAHSCASSTAPDLLFVGDVVGMVSPHSDYISIPVPPSDIDIPAWRTSIERLRALPRETRAILTHGGEQTLGPHLDAFVARMNEELPFVASLVARGGSDPLANDEAYREFLMPRAHAAGVSDALRAALLGRAFRDMNLAGVRDAIARNTYADRVE